MSVFDAALGRIFANPSMAVTALWISATSSEERSIRLIRRVDLEAFIDTMPASRGDSKDE